MLRLNHAHLPATDVGALRDFLARHFEFRPLVTRGQDAFAVLEGADGFVLALVRAKPRQDQTPAEGLHVGFFVDAPEAVHAKRTELQEAGVEVGEVEHVTRAGFSSVTFYCRAPGGLLMEVAYQAASRHAQAG